MRLFFAVAVALMTTVSINLAEAGADKAVEDVKAPKPAADPSDKGEDVSVDRDPAPRVPKVDKP